TRPTHSSAAPGWPSTGRCRNRAAAGVVEVRAMIVGLAAVEPRTLKLYRAGEHPRRHHPEGDVRAVLPMVGYRSQWIVGRRGPVGECDGSNRGLAHGGEIER